MINGMLNPSHDQEQVKQQFFLAEYTAKENMYFHYIHPKTKPTKYQDNGTGQSPSQSPSPLTRPPPGLCVEDKILTVIMQS